jgi:hypothetical protein
MATEHKIRQGETVASVAERYGLFPDAVWDDAANADLKKQRKDPNVLKPGDVLVIPDKRVKEESGGTEERHRFRKKGVPAMFRLQLVEDDEPRANLDYVLEVDGQLVHGTTDGDGWLKQVIPPEAKKGVLLIGEEERFELQLGHIDPVTEVSGAQSRLNNLGYDCGRPDGKLGAKTAAAMRSFQQQQGLTATGELDQATQDKLVKVHGC